MAHGSVPCSSDGDPGYVSTVSNAETRRQFIKKISATSAALAIGPTLLSLPGISAAQTAQSSVSPGVPTTPLKLRINGTEHSLNVDSRTTLLDLLREQLHLTGSKKGCD